MGINNKQRRAAKAKQRKRDRARAADGGFDDGLGYWAAGAFRVGSAALLLRDAVRRRVLLGDDGPLASTAFAGCPVGDQQRAFDGEFAELTRITVDDGWTPADLVELGDRRLDPATTTLLLDHVAAHTAAFVPERVDPAWRDQLAAVTSAARAPSSADWAHRHATSWPEARERLMALLALLSSLPVISETMRPPGKYRATARAATGVDERVLRRVRALLAKAESSEFDDEADALTAKAQELMTRHAIEHSLATAAPGHPREEPVARRMWISAPYVVPKALLVDAVAQANHCRSVISEHWGFVTVIGHPRDLDIVELLTASLLIQATRSMTAAGSHATRSGRSSTRSFRQSFLVAYATRIGERLRTSTGRTEAEADAEHSGALLPVLAAREDTVTAAFRTLFPNLVERGVNVSNAAGYGAGRAAADLALFDVFGQVPAAERAS